MDIINCDEHFKATDGRFTFSCMKGIVRVDDNLYLASWNRRVCSGVNQSELFDVKQLHTKNRGPKFQPAWTITDSTSANAESGHYVKAPTLYEYADDNLDSRMEKEIQICEILRLHPHPNIATYHGCNVENNHVTGLSFKRYTETLLKTVNPHYLNKRHFISSERPLVCNDMETKLDQLLDGILHLHSLNLVHNDINPANIMEDPETKTLVLIDFGSCRHIGESLSQTAAKMTHDWHDATVDISSIENDLRAFAELKVWLLGSEDQLQW